MNTQAIIIYRSPVEAATWEILSNSEYTFPVFMAVLVYLVVIMMTHGIVDEILRKLIKNWKVRTQLLTPLQLIVPSIPAFGVFKYFVL